MFRTKQEMPESSTREMAQCGRPSRRGVAAVEFAVLAPTFLILVLGTLEAGRAIEVSQLLASAIREGGRLAAMDFEGVVVAPSTPNQKVIADIRNFLDAAGLPGNAVTITLTSAEDDDSGQTFSLSDPANKLRMFKIEATVPFESIASFPVSFMKGQTLRASLTMRAGNTTLIN